MKSISEIMNMLRREKVISGIRAAAKEKEVAVYLVGGAVRDLLLGRGSPDWDFVVDGEGLGFARAFDRRQGIRIHEHARFGTATVTDRSGVRVDIATARSESYPRPGSLPRVKTGSMKEDSFRRDITINSMAFRLDGSHMGELFDPFGGREDLAEGRVRILHDRSFQDDPTRILRAVRFEQRLHFRLDRRTARLLKQALENNVFSTISPERFFQEFRKFFEEDSFIQPIIRINRLQSDWFPGAVRVFPEAVLSRIDMRRQVCLPIPGFAGKDSLCLMVLSALLENQPFRKRKTLLADWPLKRSERRFLEEICRYLEIEARRPPPRTLRSCHERLGTFSDELISYLILTRRHGKRLVLLQSYLALRKNSSWRLNGKELKGLGIRSGEEIRQWQDRLARAYFARAINTPEEARAFVNARVHNHRQGK